jgi:hypothetical protein
VEEVDACVEGAISLDVFVLDLRGERKKEEKGNGGGELGVNEEGMGSRRFCLFFFFFFFLAVAV